MRIPREGKYLLSCGIFLMLLVLTAAGFLIIYQPVQRPESVGALRDYVSTAMRSELEPRNILRVMGTVSEFGSRQTGQPGFYKAASWLEAQLKESGLEVIKLEHRSAAPLTSRRVLKSQENGMQVEVFPFLPNHFQPSHTGPDGETGELLLLNDETLLSRKRFDNAIGLIDAAAPPSGYGYDWLRYAQLGLRGIILAHRDGLEAIQWEPHLNTAPMTSVLPVNYPRAAAGADIFQLVGQQVRLDLQVRYKNVAAPAFIATLRGKHPSREALVVTTGYDAWSILPDRAYGVLQAAQLATTLQMLRGMLPYRESLSRDVIFIFSGAQMMANEGEARLLEMVGPALDRDASRVEVEQRQRRNGESLGAVEQLLELFQDARLLEDAAATQALVKALPSPLAALFQEQLTYVLNTRVLELGGPLIQAKLDLEALESTADLEKKDAAFRLFERASGRYNSAMSAGGLRFPSLMSSRLEYVREQGIRQRLKDRFTELQAFHREQAAYLEAGSKLNGLFADYANVIVISPRTLPSTGARETVGFVLGESGYQAEQETRSQGPAISRVGASVLQKAKLTDHVELIPATAQTPGRILGRLARMPSSAALWNRFAYPAFAIVNTDRPESYLALASPVEAAFMRDVESMRHSLDFAGELVLALAHGEGLFRAPGKVKPFRFSGRVLLSGVGQSLTPNYPLSGALVGNTVPPGSWNVSVGNFKYLMTFTDPYGHYELNPTPVGWAVPMVEGYSPQAFWYGEDGNIRFLKDQGPQAQTIFKSTGLNLWRRDLRDVNIVTFRAAPVSFLDMINPQSMRPYENAVILTREGLSAIGRYNTFSTGQAQTTFMEPDLPFYVALRAGAPGNESVQSTRGFMLGSPDARVGERLGGISGQGYVAEGLKPISETASEIATSMLRLNEQRLALQTERNLADERTVEFTESARLLSEQSRAAESRQDRLLRARDSVTYSTMVHPVLRQNIFHAVVSIVWYLALLVPFVFFFERLVFCFSDIRKQLAAQAAVFLTVFVLLKLLHPAFEMIRSSFMILLGFIILLIAGGITLLFAGKFRENLEELKKKRGQVSAAEPDKMGILGTAFLLGLNNMHRRKVRTGLTCGTLVLITFAMIAFTSIYSDLVETEVAMGPAPYQGFLIKKEGLAPIGSAEQFALLTKYGHRYKVSQRSMFTGVQLNTRQVFNPELELVYEDPVAGRRSASFGSILQFSHTEPLRSRIKLSRDYWFPDERTLPQGAPIPVLIPHVLAETLGIVDPATTGKPVPVKINGSNCLVMALFDGDAFNLVRDVDGQSLLPFDVQGIANVQRLPSSEVLAGPGEPRIDGSNLVLMPMGSLGITVPDAQVRVASIAVSLEDLDYRKAREEITGHLEQTGNAAFYGLGGVAYFGSRTRQNSMEGLLDMLIPLVIAGLTVLNTMKGSVYERRDEIFVYNAVGIAPRYIFFMFIAEAFVYAVVGAVLGYLLSQGTGSILTALGWTGGLNMTFAGLNAIYASLAVMVAVFISTYFPARSAMQIAAPADESGWKLPEPDGDRLAFNLPFTFNSHDRMAVLAFFHRFLLDHGEGGAGSFSAGPPEFGATEDVELVPQLLTQIWLKPYDLGVSQRMRISLPLDPETREFIANIEILRTSGTLEAWERLNHGFMVNIRKQFLHWRAVSDTQKQELFAQARVEMDRVMRGTEVTHV